MNARGRLDAGEHVRDREVAAAVADLSYQEVRDEFGDLMVRFCAPSLLVETPSSWAPKGTFPRASVQTLSEVMSADDQVHVEGEIGQFPGQRFRFGLMPAGTSWQITSVSFAGRANDWEPWEF